MSIGSLEDSKFCEGGSVEYVRDADGEIVRVSKLPHLKRICFCQSDVPLKLQILQNEKRFVRELNYNALNFERISEIGTYYRNVNFSEAFALYYTSTKRILSHFQLVPGLLSIKNCKSLTRINFKEDLKLYEGYNHVDQRDKEV
ncbi:unnamed protein product [Enterobius vermicularis]|uniref:Recep_L_domain domain-containing protein n=1 Tax=Enterobius vermicularis TaxID=51028 RepID=A0A158Q9G9_ENTVE|nr:unnamed protein product [Enterobius vermicularis]